MKRKSPDLVPDWVKFDWSFPRPSVKGLSPDGRIKIVQIHLHNVDEKMNREMVMDEAHLHEIIQTSLAEETGSAHYEAFDCNKWQ